MFKKILVVQLDSLDRKMEIFFWYSMRQINEPTFPWFQVVLPG